MARSSGLTDVEITLVYVMVLFGLLFHLDGMCNLINKNMGYIEAGKGKIFHYAVN